MSLHDFVLLLHLLGAGVVIGVIFFSLVLAFRKSLDSSKLSILKLIRGYGTAGISWMFVTGVILVYLENQDGNNLLSSKVFWVKMALIAADGILAYSVINRKITDLESGQVAAAPGLKTATVISALLFIGIVTLGFVLTLDH